MTNQIFLTRLTLLTALMTATFSQPQPERMISTLSEKTFEDYASCFQPVNKKLFSYLNELQPPEKNGDSKIGSIGKEVVEMLTKKLTSMMNKCRNGASLRVAPTVVTHLNKNGRNFYVEQIFIQKVALKPISVVEQTNAKEIEILKIRENERKAEKMVEEIENMKRDQMVANLDYEIEKLEYQIRNVTRQYEHEKTSGEYHYNAYIKADAELAAEMEKVDDLKAVYNDILGHACGCQRCRVVLGVTQTPNWFANFQASKPKEI